MTLEVAAGYEECFFVDNVKTGQAIDFEFQVGHYFITGAKFKIIYRLGDGEQRRDWEQ